MDILLANFNRKTWAQISPLPPNEHFLVTMQLAWQGDGAWRNRMGRKTHNKDKGKHAMDKVIFIPEKPDNDRDLRMAMVF